MIIQLTVRHLNHRARMKLKSKMLICQIVMLSMMSLISSEEDKSNLECYTDGIDIITCVWNSSSLADRFNITPATKCSLTSRYNDYIKIQTPQSDLEPQPQPDLLKGTLQFEKESLPEGSPTVPLYVFCRNMTEPVETLEDFYPPSEVKLYPPTKPIVVGANITWHPGSPHSVFVRNVKYEVQWRLLRNRWEKNQVAATEKEYYELPDDDMSPILGRKYVVRVRSSPARAAQFWSEWSPVTEWKATVGLQPLPEEPMMLGIFNNFTSLGIFISIAVFFMAVVCFQRHMRIIKWHYEPTPAKYFGELFSDHGGDFKSWLGPIVNPDMYIKPDLEYISPVTICNACNCDTLPNMMENDVNINDDNSSSFSNSIYFLSQSSKCAVDDQLEPCSADCPYGPTGGGSVQEEMTPANHDNGNDTELAEVTMNTPLERSSSYKQLQRLRLDIQSPDSGFAGSSEEQESQEESGSEGLPSPPVVANTLPISCILPCPVPMQIGLPHLITTPGLAENPWNIQTLQNLPPELSKILLLGNPGIMDCSGILEPSSDDYMPVKKVQG